MTRYAIIRDALYSAFKDFLYSVISATSASKGGTVEDLAGGALAKSGRIAGTDISEAGTA